MSGDHVFTIVQKYGMFAVHHERIAGSRLMWTGPRVEFWVKGELDGKMYEKAANLAMHHAELIVDGNGVKVCPAGSLKRAGGTPYKLSRSSDTKTKRMF